jgi:NAD(P)-dependent dehydrogenase (short-subunit alcohol dehydrogenase family)
MDLKLNDKIVLVTGSTKGIGLAMAESFAKEGGIVWINGRSKSSVETALSELKSRGVTRVHGVIGDVGTEAGIDALKSSNPTR